MNATLTERVKYSKTGNNNCRCLVLKDDSGDDGIWVVQYGCGEHTNNEFKQGHDAKLKSLLIKAFRADVQLRILPGPAGDVDELVDPLTLATEHGWERFLTPAPVKKSRAKSAEGQAKAVAESLDGRPARAKVGRRVFTGTIEGSDGDNLVFRYIDPADDEEKIVAVKRDDVRVEDAAA